MSKKGGKKNTNLPFKVVPKIENEQAQVSEYQLKKKILEEKYCNFIIFLFSKCKGTV
jgi:hypothetical protein